MLSATDIETGRVLLAEADAEIIRTTEERESLLQQQLEFRQHEIPGIMVPTAGLGLPLPVTLATPLAVETAGGKNDGTF